MTSDAKVGLLLGLILIFVIAFIINGLPRFLAKPEVVNNMELEPAMVKMENPSLDLSKDARQAVEQLNMPVASDYGDIGTVDVTAQPQAQEIANSGDIVDTGQQMVIQQPELSQQTLEQAQQAVAEVTPKPAEAEKTQSITYVVQKGDSLATIAKKYYGFAEGNKRANIDKIFKANQKILKAADRISIGQKLVIPMEGVYVSKDTKTASIFDSNMFEKVKMVGDRPFTALSSSTAAGESKVSGYTVKSGDNLWKIAKKELGDGNRNREVAKLNAKELANNNDDLTVGMVLRLPGR